MKDLIEERNKKEKMQNSILKWWNVHYMTPEELEEEQEKEHDPSVSGAGSQPDSAKPQETDEHNAKEIMEHYERTTKELEERKQQEIEAALMQSAENFNPRTGSYSGAYGSSGVDEEHEDQIAAILTEKDDALRSLIEHTEEIE